MARAIEDPAGLLAVGERGQLALSRYSWDRAAEAFRACYRFAAGRPLSGAQRMRLDEVTGE
jgi:hypothetical protein